MELAAGMALGWFQMGRTPTGGFVNSTVKHIAGLGYGYRFGL